MDNQNTFGSSLIADTKQEPNMIENNELVRAFSYADNIILENEMNSHEP